MLADIAGFLINILFALFGYVLLLRIWMRAVAMPEHLPWVQSIRRLSDWLVLPLQRIVPTRTRLDTAALLAAWLTALVSIVLTFIVLDVSLAAVGAMTLWLAVLLLIKWVITAVMWAAVLLALLSWINPMSSAMLVLNHLLAPILRPLRQILPQLGRLDLAPLLLFVICQVGLIILAHVSRIAL